jgi:hypothetical protein
LRETKKNKKKQEFTSSYILFVLIIEVYVVFSFVVVVVAFHILCQFIVFDFLKIHFCFKKIRVETEFTHILDFIRIEEYNTISLINRQDRQDRRSKKKRIKRKA